MAEKPNQEIWLSAGYKLFAMYGFAGIAVERLAKELNLNKSGFYHYFGNRDIYLEKLMDRHLKTADSMAKEIDELKEVDPGYIIFLIRNTLPVIFHNQLVRHRENEVIYTTFVKVNSILDPKAARLFAHFFGFNDQPEFLVKYYSQVRDMFYSQITMKQMNVEFLSGFVYQAKELIQEVALFTARR